MSRKIFRKKSLDKLNAPETLDECIKVTNPGVWLILTAAVLLLVGACIWGVFGHIDSTVSASVIAENGTLTGTLAEENAAAALRKKAARRLQKDIDFFADPYYNDCGRK